MLLFDTKPEKPTIDEILDPSQSSAHLLARAQANDVRAANWSKYGNTAICGMFILLVALHLTHLADSNIDVPLNILFMACGLAAILCIAIDSYFTSRSDQARNEEQHVQADIQLSHSPRG